MPISRACPTAKRPASVNQPCANRPSESGAAPESKSSANGLCREWLENEPLPEHHESLLVWTTTPWTLSSNVGAAVNPKLTYLKVKHKDQIYYLAKGVFTTQRLEEEFKDKKRTIHYLCNAIKTEPTILIIVLHQHF